MLHIKSILLLAAAFFIAQSAQAKTKLVASCDTLPLISSPVVKPANDTSVFVKVEVEAYFPGGVAGWSNFVGKQLNADLPAVKGAPVGHYTVVVQFKVDKEGYLEGIKPLTSFGYGMEEEVIRVIKKSPRWQPALENGEPVVAYRKQPITFVVTEKKKRRLF
jgi:periplasmic protein TonB